MLKISLQSFGFCSNTDSSVANENMGIGLQRSFLKRRVAINNFTLSLKKYHWKRWVIYLFIFI